MEQAVVLLLSSSLLLLLLLLLWVPGVGLHYPQLHTRRLILCDCGRAKGPGPEGNWQLKDPPKPSTGGAPACRVGAGTGIPG